MSGVASPKRDGLGVRSDLVGAPEGLDAGLQQLCRAGPVIAEYRTEIAIFPGLARCGRCEIIACDRDGEVRPQAEFIAGRIGENEHAAANVLAGEVEKRLRRLEDRRLDARVTGPLIGGDQRIGAWVGLS